MAVDPKAMGGAQFGADPSVHPIFGMQAYTPGLKTATSAVTHAADIYQAGKLAGNMVQAYRNMGKGSNDDPVGNLAGSDQGSGVWNGPKDEGIIDAKSWDVPSPSSSGSGLSSLAEDL